MLFNSINFKVVVSFGNTSCETLFGVESEPVLYPLETINDASIRYPVDMPVA
jgi:hypothetical protein